MIEILICSLFTNTIIYACGYTFSNHTLLTKNKTNFKPAEFLYPKDSHFGKFITRILDKVSKKKNVYMYRNCKSIEIFKKKKNL